MHLVIPFASALSQEVVEVLPTLVLPNLERLLKRCAVAARDEADAYTLSPPHERALAAAWGWSGGDGALPFAAKAAAADGLEVGGRAWGLVTPVHWQVGRDHVTMTDPAALALDADESRAFFEALRDLFESEGYDWVWGAPDRWYLAHGSLAGLPCASLDRVIGRSVDYWLDAGAASQPTSARMRRLQSEVQLLLYPHPLNEAREARGAPTVNSFWLSGCGRAQRVDDDAVDVAWALRRPVLDGDARAWADAWSALDRGAIAALLARANDSANVALTLCGERTAERHAPAASSLWQRLRARTPDVHALLADL